MYGRCVVEFTSYLYEVVHVISEETRIGCDISTIAFAYLEFMDLQEMFVWIIQFTFFHKLVVMEVWEEYRLIGVI
jgi:hypothetical protein